MQFGRRAAAALREPVSAGRSQQQLLRATVDRQFEGVGGADASDFTFNVKAFRLFTGHQTNIEALPPAVRDRLPPAIAAKKTVYYEDVPEDLLDLLWLFFIEALEPLQRAGKLGLVHFQFAPWITYSPASRAHVAECAHRLPGYALSAEFRHRTWFNDVHREYTLRFERELGLVHTVVDEPQGFANSVAAHWEVTQPDLALGSTAWSETPLPGTRRALSRRTVSTTTTLIRSSRRSPTSITELAGRIRARSCHLQ